ncbi:hypothetical protein [Paenibacillus sp. V4I5]|nr:hypothetical protein [Paenibacillus sp. V4I5]MDQ0914959.1 hypothetical protein [Paenibacillus sp. V4I5]
MNRKSWRMKNRSQIDIELDLTGVQWMRAEMHKNFISFSAA